MAELAGDVIGNPRGAHLGDGLAARGQDQVFRRDFNGFSVALKRRDKAAVGMADFLDLGPKPELCTGFFHFFQQHVHDLRGLSVAKQLSQRLFVPGDAVLPDEVEEIPLRVSGQRGFAEMRVLRKEGIGITIHIREIAAPAAGDADLFAGVFRVVHDQHIRPGKSGGHHAGGAGAKDQGRDVHGGPKFVHFVRFVRRFPHFVQSGNALLTEQRAVRKGRVNPLRGRVPA